MYEWPLCPWRYISEHMLPVNRLVLNKKQGWPGLSVPKFLFWGRIREQTRAVVTGIESPPLGGTGQAG